MLAQFDSRWRFVVTYKRHGRTLEQYAYLLTGNPQLAKVIAVMILTDYLFEGKPGTRGNGSVKKQLMELTRLQCKALELVKSTHTSAGKVVPLWSKKDKCF